MIMVAATEEKPVWWSRLSRTGANKYHEITGLRISSSALHSGKLRALYSQSDAEWLLFT